MPRLFVGIEVPPELRESFVELNDPLGDGVRPTAAADLHLTVHFIGDVDDEAAVRLRESLGNVSASALELTLNGVGSFEGRSKQKILWIGVDRTPALLELRSRIGDAIEAEGISLDTRSFNPHVTIARLNRSGFEFAEPFVAAHKSFQRTVDVDRFALFRVHNDVPTNRYEPWRTYDLT